MEKEKMDLAPPEKKSSSDSSDGTATSKTTTPPSDPATANVNLLNALPGFDSDRVKTETAENVDEEEQPVPGPSSSGSPIPSTSHGLYVGVIKDEDEEDEEEDGYSTDCPSPTSQMLEPDMTLEVPSEDGVGGEDNMRPVADAKLEQALEGQEPTTRNLIVAAIGVMKSRKARPDTKRICNWIHRRYGKPYMSIYDELELLVKNGELARVDYKGSASYRIVDSEAKPPKKRRKGTKPLGRTPSKQTSNSAADSQTGRLIIIDLSLLI